MKSTHRRYRCRNTLAVAVAEALEPRRLLTYNGPQVLPPASPDPSAGTPDKYFYMESTSGQALEFYFNQQVSISDSHALELTNLTRGSSPSPNKWTIVPTDNGATQQFKFNTGSLDYQPFSAWSGNYEAILNADLITNTAGDHLDGNANNQDDRDDPAVSGDDGANGGPDDIRTSFFFLPGDANHDRTVNITDYSFGNIHGIDNGSPLHLTGYSNGDFNYDGHVLADDYIIIDGSIGTKLPPIPTAPYTLAATAGRDAIQLFWTAPEGIDDIDWYGIWRSTDGGVTFHQIGTTGDPSDTTYYDDNLGEGLQNGTKYEYLIRAHSASGTYLPASNKYWSVTNLPPAENPTVTPIDSTSVQLEWDDNSNPGASSFDIITTNIVTGAQTTQPVSIAGPGHLTYTVGGLDPHTEYSFQVVAHTAAQTSAPSQAALATTAYDATVSISSPKSVNENTSFSATFTPDGLNANAVTSIDVDWGDGSSDTLAPLVSIDHTYADGDNVYTIGATAVIGGASAQTGTFDVVVSNVAPILTIQGDATVVAGSQYSLNLNASNDPGDDTIQYWDVDWGDGTGFTRETTSPATHTYAGVNRDYMITAWATDEDGTYASNNQSLETCVNAPAAPNALNATWENGDVQLSWNDNSADEAGFIIEKVLSGSGGIFKQIGWVAANVHNYLASGVVNDGGDTFRVYAFNAAGTSAYSNQTIPLTRGGSSTTLITFDDLPVGTIVTNQYAYAIFPSGTVKSDFSPHVLQAPGGYGGPLSVSFPIPVENLQFDTGIVDTKAGKPFGNVAVYTNGAFAGNVSLVADSDPPSIKHVNLSAYHKITSIYVTNTDAAGLAYDNFSFTPYVAGKLEAHRTGLKFGDEVIPGDDPAQYLILTNNDVEESADGEADDADATARIPIGTVDPVDDDLARITLKCIGTARTSGTVKLSASDPTAVRFFDSDGNLLTDADLTMNLSNSVPIKYADVDIWVEGLHSSPDLTLSLIIKDSRGNVVSQDDVHMMIANWTWQDASGQPATFVTSANKELLMRSGVRGESDTPVPDECKFKAVIDGLPTADVTDLILQPNYSADTVQDSFDPSSTVTASKHFAAAYWSEDHTVISPADKNSILTTLGVNAIHNQVIEGEVKTGTDDQKHGMDAAPIAIQYVGGTDPTQGPLEELTAMKDIYFVKRYMLRLTAPAGNNAGPWTWSITKGGNPVGTFHQSEKWSDYEKPLPNAPNDREVYWRSDLGTQDAESYDIAVTYPDANGKNVTAKWTLKTRLLDPANPQMANAFNDDADMAQRAIIQDFGLDKGRLKVYRPGQYDQGSTNGWYESSRQNLKVSKWSPIADEVSNFRHFALNKAFDPKLELDTIEGIWSEFDKIAAAPLPTGVNSKNTQFDNWVQQAINASGLAAPQGATKTSTDIVNALIKHESGNVHSYDLEDPLGFSSIQVGTQNGGSGANQHQFTDWGLGFAKVQPYNSSTKNLYNPDENILRGAEMFAAALGNGGIAETGDKRIWMAYYYYNCGSTAQGTVASARTENKSGGADHADSFYKALGLAPPS